MHKKTLRNNSAVSAYCFFVYPPPLFPFSFLDTVTPKCSYTSDLKVAGASTISQALLLGSSSPLAASATFALLLEGREWSAKDMIVHGLIITVVPTSFCSALLWTKKDTFCPEDLFLETAICPWRHRDTCHRDTAKLTTSLHPLFLTFLY